MRVVISLLLSIGLSECARILAIFPTPSISHQIVYHALVKDLAARGHRLTVLTTDLMKLENSNVTQIDLNWTHEIFRKGISFVEFKEKKLTELNLLETFYDLQVELVEEQLSHKDVKSLIANSSRNKFDLVIFEHQHYLGYLAFAELYDCPAVGFVSMEAFNQIYEWFGNEANPILHPEFFFPYDNENLSFINRWNSLRYYLTVKFYLEPLQNLRMERLVKQYFPTVKSSIAELQQRIDLLMTNTNPTMGFIRPILPNTIQLGFMHIEQPKQLPEGELKDFLDKSRNGVIYVSLGSNVQTKDINSETLQTIIQTFGNLSYDVLWKFEAEILYNKPDNVMISKWLPQADLLAHPKIKLFITHGGQQSMEEAIDRMIPMIVIPFLSDQSMNAIKMEKRGIGRHLEFHSLTQSKLVDAINEVLNPKYKENIRKLRELVNDQPMTSREKAVWWIEYVIRHKGAKHFEYHGRSVPFYKKFWLDFIAIFVGILFVIVKILSVVVTEVLNKTKAKQE